MTVEYVPIISSLPKLGGVNCDHSGEEEMDGIEGREISRKRAVEVA